ncbi:ribosomal protein S5, C-terminal domain-containing protein [Podospora appendiculata]|uniref:Small ribosomal subunit protein uS5m n=1 Tax=Podospora appendiculata TaxID=314037 RepID=A0AAE1C940_9PEZI|nr:ribosomal protein S5, C-terminal domain-containing protein [Podospora appendiculata]
MSAARPAVRSLFSRHLAAAASAAASSTTAAGAPVRPAVIAAAAVTSAQSPSCHHQFHSSAQLASRRRPRFKSVRAEEMGLVSEKKVQEYSDKTFPRYTGDEMAALAEQYSPAQLAALEAGEAAIDPRDLTIQGRLRVDPYRMPYIDDFAEIQPIIDRRPRKQPPPDPNARFMNLDEFTEDLIKWADQFQPGPVTGTLKKLTDFVPKEYRKKPEGQWPGPVRTRAREDFAMYIQEAASKPPADPDAAASGPTDADVLEYILERSSMTDGNLTSNSSLAPALPAKIPGVTGLYKNAIDPADEGLDDTGIYQELKKRTNMTVREIINTRAKLLVTRYVTNQTRLGKIRSTSILFVAGNGNGWLGIGVAKSVEPSAAAQRAKMLAIRNMQPIRRYEDRTIYGNVEAKVGGSVVRLFTRPPGFGLRVSHRIFEMCRAAGIKDMSAKFIRSRNPLNTVKATFDALVNQPNPEEIAIGRGKKLVDVRKVYYGGAVH